MTLNYFSARRIRPKQAFTLLELLVVLAMLSLLAAQLLPVLAKSGQTGKTARCLDNHKQLLRAWIMYADDNNGVLVPNITVSASPGPSWVNGTMKWDFISPAWPDNYNSTNLSGALLGSYCNSNTSIFKCPGDVFLAQRGPRVRSVSMNVMMHGIGNQPNVLNQLPVKYQLFFKRDDITSPAPAKAFVFIDEHADSINDGSFRMDMEQNSGWADLPASYHGGRGTLSFVDGHAETKIWTDASIRGRPVAFANYTAFSAVGTPNTDLLWLQSRTTSLTPY